MNKDLFERLIVVYHKRYPGSTQADAIDRTKTAITLLKCMSDINDVEDFEEELRHMVEGAEKDYNIVNLSLEMEVN